MPRQRRTRPLSPEHAALGAAIVELRQRAGLTQEGLAERAELHITQIGGMERGVRNPSYSTLVRLASGLGVSVGTLTVRADELRKEQ
jgi:transcriptional regulator with XRE-family HTH domain